MLSLRWEVSRDPANRGVLLPREHASSSPSKCPEQLYTFTPHIRAQMLSIGGGSHGSVEEDTGHLKNDFSLSSFGRGGDTEPLSDGDTFP